MTKLSRILLGLLVAGFLCWPGTLSAAEGGGSGCTAYVSCEITVVIRGNIATFYDSAGHIIGSRSCNSEEGWTVVSNCS